MNPILVLTRALVACATLGMASAAWAQDYPTRSIRLVVPYAPGGATDILGRTLAEKLTQSIGQPVVVENKPGAGGLIGANYVAKAPADGYTLLVSSAATHATSAFLYSSVPYDIVKDFASVTLLASYPNVLVVHPSVPAKSVKELIELAKAKPGVLNYASTGTGGTSHLAGELFKMMTGTDIVHISYKGSGPAVTDLLGGQVTLMFDSVASSLPLVTSGKLRALAVTGKNRSPALPDLPTVAEAGLPGFEASAWNGINAPAGTPPHVLRKLNAEIIKILATPDTKQRFAKVGAEPAGGSPEQFDAFIASEMDKWGKVIKKSGAKAD